MGIYIAAVKRFFSEVIVYDYASRKLIIGGSIVILVISATACALAGVYSLLIFPILVLSYYLINNNNIFVYLLVSLLPIVVAVAPSLTNIFNYAIIALIVFFWLIRRFRSSSRTAVYSRELLVFSLLVVFFSIISVFPGGINSKEGFAVVRYVLLFSFISVLYDILESKDMPKIFLAMTIPMVISSYFLFSVYSRSLNPMAMLEIIRMKVTGFLPNANLLGVLLMSVLPFWISITLWSDNSKVRVLAGSLSSIFALSILLSNSRASIFGFSAAVFMFSIWTKKLKYYIAVILISVAAFFYVPQLNSMVTIAFRVDRGTSSRVDVWRNSMTMAIDNMPFGAGMGNFGSSYDEYFKSGWERGFFVRVPHAHNFILSKVAELGVFGLIIAFGVYYMPLKTCIRAMKISKTKKDKLVSRCLTATFVSFYAHSIFEGGGMLEEGRVYPDIIFWILFIFAIKHKLFLEKNEVCELSRVDV